MLGGQVQATICKAIVEKRIVSFSYRMTTRMVEPHALGYDKSGELVLSGWQLSGGSSAGFRDFRVARLTGLATTEARFERPREGYNPNDSTLSRIVCRL